MTDGGDLRAQLESTLAKLAEAEEKIQGYVVREVAEEYSLVKPEDLTGFGTADEAKTAAESLQTERTEQQTTLLKAAGLTDEKIEQVLAGGVIDEDGELDPGVAGLSKQQSTNARRPPAVDEKQFFGPNAIKAHFKSEDAADK